MQKSKPRTALLSPVLLFCMILSTSAHPGRTDSNDGHSVGSTGDYHYNHGYGAHQHPNGGCPFGYDDQTGRTSGSSSSSGGANPYRDGDSSRVGATYSSSVPSKSSSKKGDPKLPSVPQPESTFDRRPLLGAAIALAALIVLYKPVSFLRERHTYKRQYAGFSARELAHVPEDVSFDEKDLPHTRRTLYGSDQIDQFTVYCAPHRKAYHRKGCHPAATREINLAALPPGLTPCQRCNPPPRPVWYGKYIEILKIKRKYHIN